MLDRSRQYLGLSLIMGTPKSSCSNSVPHGMAILWGCSVAPHFQPGFSREGSKGTTQCADALVKASSALEAESRYDLGLIQRGFTDFN